MSILLYSLMLTNQQAGPKFMNRRRLSVRFFSPECGLRLPLIASLWSRTCQFGWVRRICCNCSLPVPAQEQFTDLSMELNSDKSICRLNVKASKKIFLILPQSQCQKRLKIVLCRRKLNARPCNLDWCPSADMTPRTSESVWKMNKWQICVLQGILPFPFILCLLILWLVRDLN